MIFPARTIIARPSKFVTLEPGDAIATGTPADTGSGTRPQVFLKPGDVMRASIEGPGPLENQFV